MDFWFLIYALLAVAVVLFAYGVYSGLLHFPQASAVNYPFPTMTLAYKFRQQDYKNCMELYKELSKLAPGQKYAGLYYDHPGKVPSEKQRFIIGCIVAEDGATPDPNLLHALQEAGYQLFELPVAEKAIMTSFPFKNMLSIILCNKRVWHVLDAYMLKHKLSSQPWMEVHGGPDMLYVIPLDNQHNFFVRETRDAVAAESSQL